MTYTEIYQYLHQSPSKGLTGLDPIDRLAWQTLTLLGERKGFEWWWHEIEADIQDEIFDALRETLQSFYKAPLTHSKAPIDLLLFCPNCFEQHIDQAQPEKNWDNPPHRSHECQHCGIVWRPADVPTNGVATIQTKGQRDGVAFPDYYMHPPERRG